MLDPIEAYKIAIQDSYKDSLWWTAKRLCAHSDMTVNTHGSMVRSLESPTKRKLVCVPRGTYKSSIASVSYAVWLIINNPNIRILIDSEAYSNSKDLLRQVKYILMSHEFVTRFGDWRTDVWNEGEIIVKPREMNLRSPTITAGGIETIKVGQHYDVIIGDDYNSHKNSGTPEQRRKVIDHYQMNQAILDPNGIYAIIGTRYHEDDLIGWILRNELGLKGEEDLDSLTSDGGVYEF